MAAKEKIRWGILGTGGIAHHFAKSLPASTTGKLVAVASRAVESAAAFAKTYAPVSAYASYQRLLDDPNVEAVYISTPHPTHAEWCLRAAQAGKHILCEKPLTMNLAEAEEVVAAVRRAGVFLMEAFMYRCHPQIAKLGELVRAGELGKIGVIEATFSFQAPFRPEGRIYNKALGGGGILDVGCYALSIARFVAGAATGTAFANPLAIQGMGMLHPQTGADVYAIANAEFPDKILAQLACGVGLIQDKGLHVFGEAGLVHLPEPFVGGRDAGIIHLKRHGQEKVETLTHRIPRPTYALEADAVGEALRAGRLESLAIPVDDTLGNMAALDAWRTAIGLEYDGEKK
jgi:predicted dehydrogenase